MSLPFYTCMKETLVADWVKLHLYHCRCSDKVQKDS